MRDIIIAIPLTAILFVLIFMIAPSYAKPINITVTDNCCCCDNQTSSRQLGVYMDGDY